MLILVAVTVTITKEGGLFATARTAQKDTAYNAEEETLLTYIYADGVYDASTGKINLLKLKGLLEANSSKWGNITLDSNENPTTLTVTGVQSGEEHIVNTDGTMGEKKSDTSVSIAGKYYQICSNEENYMQLNADDTISVIYVNSDGTYEEDPATITYTYSPETKKGIATFIYKEEYGDETFTVDFDCTTVKDENENEVNVVLVFDGSTEIKYSAKNYSKGITPLSGNVYVNGNKTIEFSKSSKDGIDYGLCTIKEAGAIMQSGEGKYFCLNGKIFTSNWQLKDVEMTVNSDYAELTVTENGISTMYTKQ